VNWFWRAYRRLRRCGDGGFQFNIRESRPFARLNMPTNFRAEHDGMRRFVRRRPDFLARRGSGVTGARAEHARTSQKMAPAYGLANRGYRRSVDFGWIGSAGSQRPAPVVASEYDSAMKSKTVRSPVNALKVFESSPLEDWGLLDRENWGQFAHWSTGTDGNCCDQGRLVAPEDGRLKLFSREQWRHEFAMGGAERWSFFGGLTRSSGCYDV